MNRHGDSPEKGAEAIMANDISVVSPRGRLDSVASTAFERDLLNE